MNGAEVHLIKKKYLKGAAVSLEEVTQQTCNAVPLHSVHEDAHIQHGRGGKVIALKLSLRLTDEGKREEYKHTH